MADHPIVLVYGDRDHIAAKPTTDILYRRLEQNSVPIERKVVKGACHAWSPGIFQELISKCYDVRLCVWGEHAEAASITPADGVTKLDSRDWSSSERTIRRAEVAEDLKLQCIQYLNSFGLNFGVFDFAVDLEGRWHFLELNPAGNFLFCESKDPSLTWLDHTARFLRAGAPSDWKPDHDQPICHLSVHGEVI